MFKKKLWVFLKQTQPNYIKNIKHLFEQGEDYYKPLRVSDCYSNNISNMKVMVIKMKP